jgi:regulator of sigma E protease
VKQYSLLAALPAGVEKGYNTLKNYIKELRLIFTPKTEAYKSVGSFVTIGKIFPGTWDWYVFWNITALLSVMLAILNILPIPGLDGGHTLFVCYEMITGRKPNDKFLEYATYAGLIFLFGIMILAFGNDIFRLFK